MYRRSLFVLLMIVCLISTGAAALQYHGDKDDETTSKRSHHQRNKHEEDEDDEEEEGGGSKGPSLEAVPLNQTVITIAGYCGDNPLVLKSRIESQRRTRSVAPSRAKANKPCETRVTRAQFEKLTEALSPNMPAMLKRQVATAYPRLLLMGQQARELGLDQTQEYKGKMKWASMQALASGLTQEMQERADDVSALEVQKYYRAHLRDFEEVELLRIIVPRSKQHTPGSEQPAKDPNAEQKDPNLEQAEMQMEAEKVHQSAVAGEDFYELQKQAYGVAGFQSISPSVQLGKVKRSGIPPAQQKVFEMKAGQVSELFSDPGGYYVYKVLSKQMAPLAQVRPEIRDRIKSQKMQTTMENLVNSIKPELNEAYFGPSEVSATPKQPETKP